MKSDLQIQKDVMDEIKWEPYLNASQIGVAVKNGIVTLSGSVDTYFKKVTAEKAAARVSGVKAVAEDIQVGISPGMKRTDTAIAEAVISSLKWHSAVQDEKIKIKVEDGVVRLDGEVEWQYQRSNAASAVEHLSGVKSVINAIRVKPVATPAAVEQKIQAAFMRSATVDAGKVTAEVHNGEVTLHGKVRSIAEKQDAETAAWNAPGICQVDSMITVVAPEYAWEDD